MRKRVDRGPTADVAEIRGQIEAWAEAVRSKDIEKVLAHHADDIVLFDVPPPVQSLGIDAYRSSWTDTFFRWFGDAGTFEVSRLEITAGEDVAYCHGLIRCSGTEGNGRRTEELEVRLTVGLVRIDGAWTVVHEHHSQPSS
jgi:uncharacterized protein (TIGR02246 family)